MRKHILLTNDDGIDSGFLHAIARALSERFDLSIAAPASEQSWIGRAVSRHRPVEVHRREDLPWKAWTIGGTPTDCVNIALGDLLGEPPAAIVSGINIGYNTTVPLIYSSGTVAGAIEGAFWGLPAFAVSQQVPDTLFAEASQNNGRLPPEWQTVLEQNADHAADLVERILHDGASTTEAIVHNLNYPAKPRLPYETVLTVPAPLKEMPFYRKTGETTYTFHFQHGQILPSSRKTDRQALDAGEVSHSILNFSALGYDLYH